MSLMQNIFVVVHPIVYLVKKECLLISVFELRNIPKRCILDMLVCETIVIWGSQYDTCIQETILELEGIIIVLK